MKPKRRKLWARASIAMLAWGTLSAISTPASANHECRVAARDLNRTLVDLPRSEQTEQGVGDAFRGALADNPECRDEFETLATFYSTGSIGKFPFPKSGDPAHPFLGPVGWWWNVIYVSMFGRSTVLMVLFGWELFLLPFPFVLAVLAAPFSSMRRDS